MANPDNLKATKALTMFGREVGGVLPIRLAQLRKLGRQTRALSGSRPKPKG